MTANVAVSGGFDPITPGHLALFESAAALGPVTVFLNSDAWLIRKKGYFLFNWTERKDLLLALRKIAAVVPVDDADGSVCSALREHMPAWFVNGGDRTMENIPEVQVCDEIGAAMFFSGDPKISSSSMVMRRGVSERSWGKYELIYQGPTEDGYIKVKRLILNGWAETSRQKHKFRTEYFFPLSGRLSVRINGRKNDLTQGLGIMPESWHCLINEAASASSVLEVQVGAVVEEDDIERK